jgi:hypothetical protein
MTQVEIPRRSFRRVNRKILILVVVIALLLVAYMLAVTLLVCACTNPQIATLTAQASQASP